jgi:hypothetical protein
MQWVNTFKHEKRERGNIVEGKMKRLNYGEK